jgi:hypothetical protein
MIKAKEIFEFLKPDRWNVILTIFTLIIIYVWWAATIPIIGGGYCAPFVDVGGVLSENGAQLCENLVIIFFVALLLISYTLISLIVYFVNGGYKDE